MFILFQSSRNHSKTGVTRYPLILHDFSNVLHKRIAFVLKYAKLDFPELAVLHSLS